MAKLVRVSKKGIMPEMNAAKLRECASLATKEFGGDVAALEALPTEALRRVVRKFPRIGEPAAERILLYAKREPVLALESNGLQVLVRLGYGSDSSNYAKVYASVRKGLGPAPREYDRLIGAHELLRTHGKVLCRRVRPLCPECPLLARCPWGRAHAPRP